MSKRKGDKGERDVSNKIEDQFGCYAQRTGVSGGGTNRNRPDVIAVKPTFECKSFVSRVYFMEIKSRDDPTARFDKQEVHDLQEAASRGGGRAVFLVRPDLRSYDQCHAFFADELKENDTTYSIVRKMLPGKSLSDLFAGD